MGTNTAVKGLNNLIASWWAFVGFLLFSGAGFWALGLFFADLFRVRFIGLPLPDDLADIVLIFGILFIGVFFMSWGGGMINRREWGAWAGGLVRLVYITYVVGVVLLFYYRGSEYWLDDEAWLSFYRRYYVLLWAFFSVWLFWVISTTVFLFGQRRRDYYAEAYQKAPPPPLPTCPSCGLKLEQGQCPECDQPRQSVILKIGQGRQEQLLFSQDKPLFDLGRQQNKNNAEITVSARDTDHPEKISGRHLLLQYHFADHGGFTVQDLASTNKTFLNDDPTPLPPHKPYPLASGDIINLAGVLKIIFEIGDAHA